MKIFFLLKKIHFAHIFYNCDLFSMDEHPNRSGFKMGPTSDVVSWRPTFHNLVLSWSYKQILKKGFIFDFFNVYLSLGMLPWEKIIARCWPLFGVTSGLTTSWRFFLMVSFMISSISGLGSSTGTSRVFPRCWLYCRAHPSTCPSLHHSLMEAWLRRSHTPSSLWIWYDQNIHITSFQKWFSYSA